LVFGKTIKPESYHRALMRCWNRLQGRTGIVPVQGPE
jgi:hypothetical protein